MIHIASLSCSFLNPDGIVRIDRRLSCVKLLYGERHWMDNRWRIKIYLAMFIRALHVEIVSEPITDAFLTMPFVWRCGECYLDNATNFTGTNRELKELYNFSSDHKHAMNQVGRGLTNQLAKNQYTVVFDK